MRASAVAGFSLVLSGCVSEQRFTGGSTESFSLADASAGSSTPPIVDPELPPETDPRVGEKPACDKKVDDPIAKFEARCRADLENRDIQDVADFDFSLVRKSGNFFLKGLRLDLIDLVAGNLFFHSSNPNLNQKAPVQKLEGGTGNFFFCYANITSIEGFRGNLHIFRGDVGEIRSSTGNVTILAGNLGSRIDSGGNLRLVNGSIGQIQGSGGNVSVENGNIGDIRNSSGNITIRNGARTGVLESFRGNLAIIAR